MKRLLLTGAALLALSGLAVAQTPPDSALPTQSEAPAIMVPPPPHADAPGASTAPGAEAQASPRMRDGRGDRMKRHHMGKMGHGDTGHHGWRHGRGDGPAGFHHGGGTDGNDGARFTFQGPGSGKVDIRCAAGESTQDCVDAVLPMLQDLMQEFHRGSNRP